jgi:hypothetical protein
MGYAIQLSAQYGYPSPLGGAVWTRKGIRSLLSTIKGMSTPRPSQSIERIWARLGLWSNNPDKLTPLLFGHRTRLSQFIFVHFTSYVFGPSSRAGT